MFVELLLSLLALLLSRTLWRRWRYDLHKIPSPSAWPYFGKVFEVIDVHRQGIDQNSLYARWLAEVGNPQIMRVWNASSHSYNRERHAYL